MDNKRIRSAAAKEKDIDGIALPTQRTPFQSHAAGALLGRVVVKIDGGVRLNQAVLHDNMLIAVQANAVGLHIDARIIRCQYASDHTVVQGQDVGTWTVGVDTILHPDSKDSQVPDGSIRCCRYRVLRTPIDCTGVIPYHTGVAVFTDKIHPVPGGDTFGVDAGSHQNVDPFLLGRVRCSLQRGANRRTIAGTILRNHDVSLSRHVSYLLTDDMPLPFSWQGPATLLRNATCRAAKRLPCLAVGCILPTWKEHFVVRLPTPWALFAPRISIRGWCTAAGKTMRPG